MNADKELTVSAMTQFLLASMNHQKDVRQIKEFISKYSVGHLIKVAIKASHQQLGESFQLSFLQLMQKLLVRYASERTKKTDGELEHINDIFERYVEALIQIHNGNNVFLQVLLQIKSSLQNLRKQDKNPLIILILKLDKGKLTSTQILQDILSYLSAKNFDTQQLMPSEICYFFNYLRILLSEDFNFQNAYVALNCLEKMITKQKRSSLKMLNMQEWMPLLKKIIEIDDSLMNSNLSLCITKDTKEYFYFHSKQYALQILEMIFHTNHNFLQSHYRNRVPIQNVWINRYGKDFIKILVQLLQKEMTTISRYHHLNCLLLISTDAQLIIKPYCDRLKYDLLLPFIAKQQWEQRLMISDYPQFHHREVDQFYFKDNISPNALELWISLARINLGNQIDCTQEFNFIAHLLDSNSPQKKYAAFSLLREISDKFYFGDILQFVSTIFQKYFVAQFRNARLLMKNEMLNCFINQGQKLKLDDKNCQLALMELFKAFTQTNAIFMKFKCFKLICFLGSKNISLYIIQNNIKPIIHTLQYLLPKFDISDLIQSIQLLTLFNTRKITHYFRQIFTKIIRILIKFQYKQFKDHIAGCYSQEIMNILAKSAQILQGYQDYLIYSQYVMKFTKYVQLCEADELTMMKIVRIYIQRGNLIYMTNRQQYADIWKHIIAYQQDIVEGCKEGNGTIILQENIYPIQFIYLQINLYFIEVLKEEIPVNLLLNIIQFHKCISGQPCNRQLQNEDQFQYLLYKLFGLILIYFWRNKEYEKQIEKLAQTVFKYVIRSIKMVPYERMNIFILIINSIFKIGYKVRKYITLPQYIFAYLIQFLRMKINNLIKQQQSIEYNISSNSSLSNVQSDSSSQNDHFIKYSLQSDEVLLIDYRRTMEKICSEDYQFYQRIIMKVPKNDLDRFNHSVLVLTTNIK